MLYAILLSNDSHYSNHLLCDTISDMHIFSHTTKTRLRVIIFIQAKHLASRHHWRVCNTALNIPWLSFNHSGQIPATIETGISMERLPRRPNNNANFEYYAKQQIGYVQGQCKYLQALRLSRYLLNVQCKFEQSFARDPNTVTVPIIVYVAWNPSQLLLALIWPTSQFQLSKR